MLFALNLLTFSLAYLIIIQYIYNVQNVYIIDKASSQQKTIGS